MAGTPSSGADDLHSQSGLGHRQVDAATHSYTHNAARQASHSEYPRRRASRMPCESHAETLGIRVSPRDQDPERTAQALPEGASHAAAQPGDLGTKSARRQPQALRLPLLGQHAGNLHQRAGPKQWKPLA